jgi:hypothetical protein
VNWGCAISESQISDRMPNRRTDINCLNLLTLYAFSDRRRAIFCFHPTPSFSSSHTKIREETY